MRSRFHLSFLRVHQVSSKLSCFQQRKWFQRLLIFTEMISKSCSRHRAIIKQITLISTRKPLKSNGSSHLTLTYIMVHSLLLLIWPAATYLLWEHRAHITTSPFGVQQFFYSLCSSQQRNFWPVMNKIVELAYLAVLYLRIRSFLSTHCHKRGFCLPIWVAANNICSSIVLLSNDEGHPQQFPSCLLFSHDCKMCKVVRVFRPI